MDHDTKEVIVQLKDICSSYISVSDEFNDKESQDSTARARTEAVSTTTNSSLYRSESVADSLRQKVQQLATTKHLLGAVHGDKFGFGHDGNEHSGSNTYVRPWRMTFIRFGPLSGIFTMFLALTCLVASFGILTGSDGQAVADWSITPATYLAIFTAIANLSVRYAAISGVAVAWWYRAIRGSTLAKLHMDWKSGTTLRGALTAGREIGLLGVACIFSTIVIVDGPLLQRSSSVIPASIVDRSVRLRLIMAPEIPRDYTGTWQSPNETGLKYGVVGMFNSTIPGPSHPVSNYIVPNGFPKFAASVICPWQRGEPLFAIEGCPHKCTAKIQAPALFATECVSHQLRGAYMSPLDMKLEAERLEAPPLDHSAFVGAVSLDVSESQETLNLIAGHSNLVNCTGDLHYTLCTLRSGIGEYSVSVDGNETTLDAPVNPKFVALAQNANVNHTIDPELQGHPSTLAKVAQEATWFFTTGMYYFKKDSGVGSEGFGFGGFEEYQLPAEGLCNSYRDPKEDFMQGLNQLMVYLGAHAATEDASYLASHMDPGLEAKTDITGYLTGERNVFHTNYWYFLGAAIVEVTCIALVVPTYCGWWKIGRPVSLSPLEMAKAFGAPLLAACNSNSSGGDLTKDMGDMKVQYGVVRNETESGRTAIAFANPERVEKPQDGMRFDR